MKNLISLVCGLALFQILVAGASISDPFSQLLTTRQQVDAEQVRRELGSRLSKGTLIFGPDDENYGNATARFSNFSAPQIQVVVMPDQESDIPAIVCAYPLFCTMNSRDTNKQQPTHYKGPILQPQQHPIPRHQPRTWMDQNPRHLQRRADQHGPSTKHHHQTRWQIRLDAGWDLRRPGRGLPLGPRPRRHHGLLRLRRHAGPDAGRRPRASGRSLWHGH